MKLDQYSIFFTIAFLSAGLILFLGITARRLRGKKGTTYFTVMLILISIWTYAVNFGMLARTEEWALFWVIIRMVGVIFTPVAWFFLVLQYTGRSNQINAMTMVLTSVIPVVSLILLITNPSHSLFYTNIEFIQTGFFMVDENWHFGTYFIIHALYCYTLVLVGDFLILKEAIQMSRNFRVQSITLILATIIPLVVNISYTFHLIPELKVNYDPLGFVVSMLIFGWGIYYYQLFDLSPIARETLVDNMVDGMIVINQNNQIVDMNPAAKNIFRLDDSMIGRNLATVMSCNNLPHLNAFGRTDRQEIELASSGGKSVIFDVQYSSIQNQEQVMGKLVTVRNITEQKNLETKLQQIAITDALTGLANHRHFYELLNAQIARSMRSKNPFSLVMFDIDLFKQVNDSHGHLVGDEVLRDIARIGKELIRGYDELCRYGGEEFSLILSSTHAKEACAIAERIRQVIETNKFQVEGIPLRITISLGVANYDPTDPISPKELVNRADQSLYTSKDEGRNRVTCWE